MDDPTLLSKKEGPFIRAQVLGEYNILITGTLLLCLTFFLRHVSEGDAFAIYSKAEKLSFSAAVLFVAGIILFVSQSVVMPTKKLSLDFYLIVCIGLLSRAILFHHTPILENDYYRYLHDGAITAHIQNPYQYSPQQVATDMPDALSYIYDNKRAIEVNLNINHPHLRTIYPPVAQLVFALAHYITPYQLDGLRLIYLLFDIVNVLLIVQLLKHFKLPVGFVIFYLWNPILIFETYQRCHYDLIVGTFVLFFCWAIVVKRYKTSVAALALAVGAKLWPLILIPFFIYPLRYKLKELFICCLLFVGILLCVMMPQMVSVALENNSGVLAYAKEWIANEMAYHSFHKIGERFHRIFYNIDARLIARGLIVALLITVSVYTAMRSKNCPRKMCESVCAVTALMLLWSPTFYGWYYLAMLPLAAVTGRPTFLIWTLLIPLSYVDIPELSKLTLMICFHLPLTVMLIIYFSPWHIKMPWMIKKAPDKIV